MSPSYLTFEAVAIVLLAPAMSLVAAARPRRSAWTTVTWLVAVVAVLVTTSTAAAVADRAASGMDARAILVTHATLAAAALAFGALGVLGARLFSDALDAAAASGALALALTFAVLFAGEWAARLPAAFLDASLLASPLVAIASAANIDVLREQTWYHLSPIAHRNFNYPIWYQAAATYFVISCAFVAASIWKTEKSL